MGSCLTILAYGLILAGVSCDAGPKEREAGRYDVLHPVRKYMRSP